MDLKYLSKKVAEKMAGIKLDGRRKYLIWGGIVCVVQKFTHSCSGCSSDDPYEQGPRGFGCKECGYTGKRRNSFPCPVNPKQVV